MNVSRAYRRWLCIFPEAARGDFTGDVNADVSARLAACVAWDWPDGSLTHTTHASRGLLPVPVGTPVRLGEGRGLLDDVVEGRFGPITPEPSHHHPDFAAQYARHDADIQAAQKRAMPDLSDAATVGCLLARVRTVLAEPTLHARPSHGGWYVERETASGDHEWLHLDGTWGEGSTLLIWCRTEAAALVTALETSE